MKPLHLKPYDFPAGFQLLVDTREQTPLFTRFPKGLSLCSVALADGDYSILGYEDRWTVERKGLSDLIAYCTRDREKTMAKMERFRSMDWVGLAIEVDESDLLTPYLRSAVSPESIRQSLVSFSVRYGVHVYANGDRRAIERFVVDHAIKFYRVQQEERV